MSGDHHTNLPWHSADTWDQDEVVKRWYFKERFTACKLNVTDKSRKQTCHIESLKTEAVVRQDLQLV